MLFNNEFIKKLIPKAIISGQISKKPSVKIDSRLCQKGDIFFALEGKVQNGHDFISNAIENGADTVVINDKNSNLEKGLKSADINIIIVPDTLEALIDLAKGWRNQFELKIIGITGSVGKTTTKEMIASILNLNKTNYLASQGNYNTLIGVSITLFNLRTDHQVALIEMGISRRGEMAKLVDLVRPNTSLITYLAHSHVSGLGSLSDISLEKRAIFNNFKPENIGIINGDQALLSGVAYNHPVIRFGSKTTNQVQCRKVRIDSQGANFLIKIYNKKYNIFLKHGNLGTVNNALAATALATTLGINHQIIVQALNLPLEIKGRYQFKELANKRGSIIDDCYNANPESMLNSILAFEAIKTSDRKIAVLGDMNELGIDSPYWHKQIGRFFKKAPSIDKVILVGQMIKYAKENIPLSKEIAYYQTWQEAAKDLQNEREKVLVLAKASTYGYTKGLVELVNFLTEENLLNNQNVKKDKAVSK